MLNHEWYVKDSCIVSSEVKIGEEGYNYQETVCIFVGSEVAKHIVKLHNDSLRQSGQMGMSEATT